MQRALQRLPSRQFTSDSSDNELLLQESLSKSTQSCKKDVHSYVRRCSRRLSARDTLLNEANRSKIVRSCESSSANDIALTTLRRSLW
jgi:hypothetical protein